MFAQAAPAGPGPVPYQGIGLYVVILIAAVVALEIYRRRFAKKIDSRSRQPDKPIFSRPIAWLVGGILGVIVVRAFLLNEVEKIGFSLVMNNLTKISSSDFSTILNSSTFLKCVVGFFAGCVAGDFGYRAYLKNKTPQLVAPAEAQTSASATTQAASQRATSESRLTELLALKEKGLITAEDYEKKRADIVREL